LEEAGGEEDNVTTKIDQYVLEIKDGWPPKRCKTKYDAKMPNGALIEIAARIKPGQHVEDMSAGSAGKLAKLLEPRGLVALSRRRQGESREQFMWFRRNG
jgi:hypothetical protein